MERVRTTRVVSRQGAEVRVLRTCLVEVMRGPDAGRVARLDKPSFRIGTEESNDLTLGDETVSKHHLEVAVVAEGYRLTDLGSSNGTFVGSTRLGELTVLDPISLRLGRTTLRLTPTDEEAEVPASPRTRFGRLVGRSLSMRELFVELENIARTDSSVLLEGETGVGKDLVAESLHEESPRRRGPFIVVDCGALSGERMEAELFGHVRGAFTGAETARTGLLESADGGTLFLDEVGELGPGLQTRLLGALERRRVTPLGASTPRPIDVRVIAATHRELAREVNQGRFRADLYYRLAVVRLRIPPLRERLEDVPLLVEGFLGALRERHGDTVPAQLSAVALSRLSRQSWPGNVRELRNAVERAAAGDGSGAAVEPGAPWEPYQEARDRFVADFERQFLVELLVQHDHNVRQAALKAGVELRYFRRLLSRYQISPRDLKPR